MKRLSSIAMILSLCGCVQMGAPYSAHAIPHMQGNKAQIIVYKPTGAWTEYAGQLPREVNVNEIHCSLPVGAFFIANVPPGKTEVHLMDGSDKISYSLQAHAGERYYVRISENKAKMRSISSFGLVGMFAYNAANAGTSYDHSMFINLADAGQAQEELADTKQALGCE